MAVFSIELPDRRVVDIEAGDESTAVRGAREWHQANPLSTAETAVDVGDQAVRGLSRGIVSTVTAPYRALDWLGEKITGTGFLPEAADMPMYRPYLGEQPAPRTPAGRRTGAAAEAIGASAVPMAGMMQAASRLPMVARSAAPGVAETFLRPIASAPGTATAIDVAASTGAGLAQDAAREAGGGPTAQTFAALAGGLAPIPAASAAARTMSGASTLGQRLANRLSIRASAEGEAGAITPAAIAAADQRLADEMLRAGLTVDEVKTRFAQINESRRFESEGLAQNVTALADLDEALARLGGSTVRQSTQAARETRHFLQGRQTGRTPAGTTAEALAERGIPTRPAFSDPITGEQAERLYGRQFDAPDKGPVPMGMVERARDALRRAFQISDADYHGHGTTGLRTEQRIVRRAQDDAQTNYDGAYAATRGTNLRDAIAPVFDRHLADAAANEAPAVENLIRRVQGMFRQGPIELQQFDRTKRAVDDIIKRFLNRPDKSGVHMGGRINDLKRDLLKAVDDATGGETSPYLTARNAFSSEMDMLNALRAGRQALRDDSEITADAFKALMTEGEQSLFQLGLLDAISERGRNMPRSHDFTKVFDTPRVEDILAATIERSKAKNAVFRDRPERFGRYVESQRRQIEARNTTQGGSTTARNIADDAVNDALTTVAIGNVNSVVNALRGSQSGWQFGQRMFEMAIDKAFGMRAEHATILARMLFTADEAQIAQILTRVGQRMSPDRMRRFNEILEQAAKYQQAAAAGGSAAIGAASGPAAQQPTP